MKNLNRTHLLVALASIVCLLAGAAVAQAVSNKTATSKGVTFIRKANLSSFPGTGFRSDTISALAAARKIGVSVPSKTMSKFLDPVEEESVNYAGSAGATAKLILAATALGRNPGCFGPKNNELNLPNILTSDYNAKSGQFGRTSFDHALALLALKAAHEPITKKAVTFAKDRRGKYGWNFAMSKSSGDDVESSALMIEALRAAGVSRKSSSLKSAYKWITYQRNQDGGYNPDTPQGETQADTTAYAIRAFDALGIVNSYSKNAKRSLRALQQKNGGFRFSPTVKGDYLGISTANATLALSGQHYPVVARSKKSSGCNK
ncbi:MAG: hypothetical protein JHC98_07820 [Thermoleophilaceae bacterium]|nr:hypothetical protein [Thermoleophilaceae bacterium]